MIIKVRVMPNSKAESITEVSPSNYRVKIRAKAIGGRANGALICAIAAHFNVPSSQVSIASGMLSRNKTININIAGAKSRAV